MTTLYNIFFLESGPLLPFLNCLFLYMLFFAILLMTVFYKSSSPVCVSLGTPPNPFTESLGQNDFIIIPIFLELLYPGTIKEDTPNSTFVIGFFTALHLRMSLVRYNQLFPLLYLNHWIHIFFIFYIEQKIQKSILVADHITSFFQSRIQM